VIDFDPATESEDENGGGRKAESGERCTCGRQAVTVYPTEDFGEVGWCGRSDGGDRSGPCPFCRSARHDWPLCPSYKLRLD
jgi:hypothetical protein